MEAIRHYKLAADKGHARAQYKIGLRYEFSNGVTEDKEEAKRYITVGWLRHRVMSSHNVS